MRGSIPAGYGEAPSTPFSVTLTPGLSPRVRGSHAHVGAGRAVAGSIPAGTGKPLARRSLDSQARVYPRGYGEASPFQIGNCFGHGLSPRVRGSPTRWLSHLLFLRSIPAGTGKPPNATYIPDSVRVYPRGYGEALVGHRHTHPPCGLSPRVRGSQRQRLFHALIIRSIPAGTGKPIPKSVSVLRTTVYPRGYGEALPLNPHNALESGLSPRVRGSPFLLGRPAEQPRSIPAGTGKPTRPHR